jgi:hypothetical protein
MKCWKKYRVKYKFKLQMSFVTTSEFLQENNTNPRCHCGSFLTKKIVVLFEVFLFWIHNRSQLQSPFSPI